MRGERGTVEALTAWRTEHPIQGQQRIDARRMPWYHKRIDSFRSKYLYMLKVLELAIRSVQIF
jgi:hypothetical protein